MGLLEFWSNIWAKPHNHSANAGLITKVKADLVNIQKHERIEISAEAMAKVLGKLLQWESAGSDGVKGYLANNIVSLRELMVEQLTTLLNATPEWITGQC